MADQISQAENTFQHLSQIDCTRRLFHLSLKRYKGRGSFGYDGIDREYMGEQLNELRNYTPDAVRKGSSKFFWRKNPALDEQAVVDGLIAYSPQLRVDNQPIIDSRINYYGRDFVVKINNDVLPGDLTVSEINLGLLQVNDPSGKCVGILDLHPLRFNEGIDEAAVNVIPLSNLFEQSFTGKTNGANEPNITEFVHDYPKFLHDYPEVDDRPAQNSEQTFFPSFNLSSLPLEGKFHLWRYLKSIDPSLQFKTEEIRKQWHEIHALCIDWGPDILYLFQALDGDLTLIKKFLDARTKGATLPLSSSNNENIKRLLHHIRDLEIFTPEETALEYGIVHPQDQEQFGTIQSHLRTKNRALAKSIVDSFFDPAKNPPLPDDTDWDYVLGTTSRLAAIPLLTAQIRDLKLPLRKDTIPFELLDKAYDYLAKHHQTEPLYDANVLWFISQALVNQADLDMGQYNQWTKDFYRFIAPIIYKKERADAFVKTPTEVNRLVNGFSTMVTDGSIPGKPVCASIGIGEGRVELKWLQDIMDNPDDKLHPSHMYGLDMMAELAPLFKETGVDFDHADIATWWKQHPQELDFAMLNWSPLNNQALIAMHLYYAFAIQKALKTGGVVYSDTALLLQTSDLRHSFWQLSRDFQNRFPDIIPGAKPRKPEYKTGNEAEDEVGTFSYSHQWYMKVMDLLGFEAINIPAPDKFKQTLDHFAQDNHQELVVESEKNTDPRKYPVWAAPDRRISYLFKKVRDIDLSRLDQMVTDGEIPPLIALTLKKIDAFFQARSFGAEDQNTA